MRILITVLFGTFLFLIGVMMAHPEEGRVVAPDTKVEKIAKIIVTIIFIAICYWITWHISGDILGN